MNDSTMDKHTGSSKSTEKPVPKKKDSEKTATTTTSGDVENTCVVQPGPTPAPDANTALLTNAMTSLANNIGVLNAGMQKNMEKMNELSKNFDNWMGQQFDANANFDFSFDDYPESYQTYDNENQDDTGPNDSPRPGPSNRPTEVANENLAVGSQGDKSEPPNKRQKFLSMMSAEAQYIDPKGDNIDVDLANNITSFMRSRPDEQKIKELYDSLPAPANCPGLEKIVVNENIWARISSEARSHDVKLQRVHVAMMKGTTAVAMLCNKLLAAWDAESHSMSEEELSGIMDLTTKAFRAFGAANFELTMRRREAMKSTISGDFLHLCAPSVPFSNKLFGDDVTKTIKEISDDNRVNKRAFMSGGKYKSKSGGAREYHPYRRGGRDRGRPQSRQSYNRYQNQGFTQRQGYNKNARQGSDTSSQQKQ